uniref:hypothetical protein n=1 Tax=Enterococcus faecium TaxID=1352 RepID=UPI0034E95519
RNGPADDDSHDYPHMLNPHFAAIRKSKRYTPNELLRRLLIESATTTTVGGGLWCRNYGDRVPLRGGYWNNGSGAGLGALHLYGARSNTSRGGGFRPAFFV